MYFAPPPKNFGKNIEGLFSKMAKGFWVRVKRIFGVVSATGKVEDIDRELK